MKYNDLILTPELIEEYTVKYPDWKNDEYNCGPNLYIWGIPTDGSEKASFVTLNDMDIYYNRESQKYFLDIETIHQLGYVGTCTHLEQMKCKLYNYLKENNKLDFNYPVYDLESYRTGAAFEASNLTELYFKYYIFTEGYKAL